MTTSSQRLNSSWVELYKSRGHETYSHKLFMRRSVLSADILMYIPAIIYYYMTFTSQQNDSKFSSLISAFLALVYPGLMLIDYGHFQYNCISLGLTIWAIIGLAKGHDILGAVAFTLALNYKQMSLYFAMPFFTYLLGKCIHAPSRLRGFVKLVCLGLAVIGTFVSCWAPFLHRLDLTLQVLHRLFPFARGLFEDKVANVWCSLSVVIKFKQLFEQQTLVRISLVATLVAVLPSSLHLLVRPSIRSFKYALVNSALAFFLFSFQVHEKSILLAALPVCLMFTTHPLLSVWFLVVSTFSMLPLLIKDGLLVAYLGSMVVFFLVARISIFNGSTTAAISTEKQQCVTSPIHLGSSFWTVLFWLSCVGMAMLTSLSVLVAPPAGLPDLHSLLVCGFSCCHFMAFLVIFHWLQFTSPLRTDTKLKAN